MKIAYYDTLMMDFYEGLMRRLSVEWPFSPFGDVTAEHVQYVEVEVRKAERKFTDQHERTILPCDVVVKDSTILLSPRGYVDAPSVT